MSNPVLLCLRSPKRRVYEWRKPDGTAIPIPWSAAQVTAAEYGLTAQPQTEVFWHQSGDIAIATLNPWPAGSSSWNTGWTAFNGALSWATRATLNAANEYTVALPTDYDSIRLVTYGDLIGSSGKAATVTATGANAELRADIDPWNTKSHQFVMMVWNGATATRTFQPTQNGNGSGYSSFTVPAKSWAFRRGPTNTLTAGVNAPLGVRINDSANGEVFAVALLIVACPSLADAAGASGYCYPPLPFTTAPFNRGFTWSGTAGNSKSTMLGNTFPALAWSDVELDIDSGGVACRIAFPESQNGASSIYAYQNYAFTAGDFATWVNGWVEGSISRSGFGTAWGGTFMQEADQTYNLFLGFSNIAAPPHQLQTYFFEWNVNSGITQVGTGTPVSSARKRPSVFTSVEKALPVRVLDTIDGFGGSRIVEPCLLGGYVFLNRPLTAPEKTYLNTDKAKWHERMFAAAASATVGSDNRPGVVRGDDVLLTLTILDEHELGMVLWGKTVWLTVKPTVDADATDAAALFKAYIAIDPTGAVTASNGLVIDGALDEGKLTLTIPASVTATFPPGRLPYDVQVSGPEGTVTLLRGALRVSDDVTRRATMP